MSVTRRAFVKGSAAASLSVVGGCLSVDEGSGAYPGWRRGELDIHFIHTGVGEQTFFIFPDGTTMLLDCGDTHHAKYMCDVPPQPSGDRYGGEWVSRYIQRLVSGRTIDYVMVSHWHGDHTGDLMFGGKNSADGRIVCGIPLVGEHFTFRHYLDHQYPKMGGHAKDPDPDALRLMKAWIPYAMKRDGMTAEKVQVGALNQIKLLKDAAAYPSFEIRNLAGNGVLWDGKNGIVDCARVQIEKTGKDEIHENRLSAAIRIRYGAFAYYTGGDNELTMIGENGKAFNWEQTIGKVCGPVDVAKTNHHAGAFGMSPEFVRELRAKVYLSSVWQPKMVDHKSLSAMCSRELYSGDRLVCFGYIADKVKEVAAAYDRDLAPGGHAVVKVAPGGGTFKVYTLNAADESMAVLACFRFESGGPKT
ncbi:MAG: MBL fold metallo-hydrolase [Kiritimatiellae bacterium]|nr:MBL fold metallo-hydrolase [Kiritimatiellia bacterium]MDD3544234.1 MBL fold metallo-hydrolase [Kiritimatiellia bacterium]MDD4025286.1 MBL fold metallo-hydrolase [Kiritimatiellia bacterium]